MEIVSLKMDFAFREIMEDVQVRRYFIADVLDIPVEQIRETKLGNTFLRRHFRMQKQGILDVKVYLQDGTRINIEMQLRRQKFWDKRSLYYLSKMYSDVLFVGEGYNKLRRCISIHILEFNLIAGERYHTVYRMRDEQGKDYSDLLELHTIELRKRLCGDDRVDDWIRLINSRTEEDLSMIKTKNIGIQRAKQIIQEMSLTDSIRETVAEYRKIKMDRKMEDAYVFDRGLEQGLDRGRGQGEEKMAQLTKILMEEGRQEELKRAIEEPEFRELLFRHYGL